MLKCSRTPAGAVFYHTIVIRTKDYMKKLTRPIAKKAAASKPAPPKAKKPVSKSKPVPVKKAPVAKKTVPVAKKPAPAAKKPVPVEKPPVVVVKKAPMPAAPPAAPKAPKAAPSAPISVWEDDPESGLKTVKRPSPTLTLGPLPVEITGPAPKPAIYPTGTPNFRYWTAADALRRTRDLWKTHMPEGAVWHDGHPLKVELDAGQDLNAYYDRKSLSFYHAKSNGRVIYACESADIVCHEFGHAVLDVLRPDLWDACLDEVASFHEAFGDLSAILSALQLQSVREAVIKETSGHLYHDSIVSRMAEQFGKALHGINPHAAPPNCLRNAVNLFFYHDPMHLPPSAPETTLSSEPHSFSRLFTGAFFEAMAGMLSVHSKNPTQQDLLQVANDATTLLVKGTRTAALSAAFFSEVAAQIIWAEAPLFNGKYEEALRSAFVRRGILSLDAVRSLKAEALRALTAKPGTGTDDMPRGRDMMMRASSFGLGEGALVVRTASFSRRGAIAPSALDSGSTPVPGVEQATQAFLETLFRRGRVDFSQAKPGISAVTHSQVRRKTHYIIEQNGQFHLRRRCFDESAD